MSSRHPRHARRTVAVLALLLTAAPVGVAPLAAATAAPAAASADTSWFVDPRTPAERRAEIAVPARPKQYDGRKRETRAVYRTKAGQLAVPMRLAFGHHLVQGQAVTLDGAGLFATNSVALTPAARLQVVRLAGALDQASSVRCEGYADYAGAATRNRELATGRATAVCALLARTKDGLQTAVRSYGPSWPAVVGGAAEGRRLNRRVVVEMTGTIPAGPVATAPGAPSLVNSYGTDSAVFFSYFPPADDGGSPVTGYEVSIGDGWSAVQQAIGRPGGSRCRGCGGSLDGYLPGLTPETSVDLQVRAVNAVGPGAPSNTRTTPVYGKPSAPTALSVVGGDTLLSVSFGGPVHTGGVPIQGYEVSYDLGLNWSPLAGDETGGSVQRTDVVNGTTYDVWVRALNGYGAGPAATGSALVNPPPCRSPRSRPLPGC